MCKQLMLLPLCLLAYGAAYAQRFDTASVFNTPVTMDAVVIKAARAGWDVQAFIKRVQTDTTFFKAFKSMRVVPYTAINNIRVYNNDNSIEASMQSKTMQHVFKTCRTMQTFDSKTTGNFYKKNGRYVYYTAELYDYLFFTKDTLCGNTDVVADALNEKGSGTIEKNKYRLKQLIFNPGSKITGIPLIGNKASIFDEDEAKKYDFHLLAEKYDGEDCYVFKVTPKPGYDGDVVFNELTTWFRKKDYSIIARNYSLSYHTWFYDFDVHMKVRTTQVGSRLLPTSIDYDGNWHVIAQKRERVKFLCTLSY
jgi:hypothetical protein